MGEVTKIEWCDHTWSPWIGCTKLSGACDHCYAADMAKRYGWAEFAAGAPRHRTSANYWMKPLAWNRQAEAAGKRATVFASLCDPFDSEVDDAWRADHMAIIEATPWLEWLLLTKRAKLARQFFKGRRVPDNVRMGTTSEDQKMLQLRGPDIVAIKAKLLPFLSAEPLLGPLDLDRLDRDPDEQDRAMPSVSSVERFVVSLLSGRQGLVQKPDPARGGQRAEWWIEETGRQLGWVIAGGESGPKARPSHPDWFRSLRDQCQAAGVPYFFKQWGDWHADALIFAEVGTGMRPPPYMKIGKKAAGAMLDGREWREFPT